jgi:subtilisin family serine protease
VIAAGLVLATLVVFGPPAAAAPAAAQLGRTHVITLVTGDVVRLSRFADGREAVTVDPEGPGSRRGYQLLTRNGDTYVIPVEATKLLAAGRLDEALFNVTDLVADGYDAAARPTLPLLLTQPAGLAPLAAPAAASVRTHLASVNGIAVAENKARAKDFWASIAGGAGKVWLDRKVHATLADSVPQIGAPEAWAKGLDGTGVRVAVLDTGYDPGHPDLAGRVAEAADFTGEGSTKDGHGHGTHVAATVGGHAGKRTGVAPGATLLVGRVLDGAGTGDLSWVIAGMEWAVAQGAKVVNLSLGAGRSDGTDPVSEAVNTLSRNSGALFVIAAGNDGPDPETVDAPGAATEALTVGAVSKSDTLARFSSRGPRLGDAAVKPEITAPGVNIIAARAEGTSLGELIDARYTSLSGTSMATPHVAGAAAILAQQHPDWRASQLKAALVGSARPVDPSAPPNAMGAGRVDVPAAINTPVLAEPASVLLGQTDDTRSAKVNYRNLSSQPVSLDLGVSAAAPGSPSAALKVSPNRLTIAPGASATATLALDPGATKGGAYTGQLVAKGPQGTVRTPVGFKVTGPTHTLTVAALDRLGRPAGSYSQAQLWNLDTGEFQRGIIGAEPARLTVPPGRYALMVYVFTVDEGGWEREVTVLGEPQLTINGDRTLRFDARTASPVRVITPQDAEIRSAIVAWQRVAGSQSLITGFGFNPRVTQRYSAAATAPVSVGSFELTHHFELAEPMLVASALSRGGGARLPNPRHVDGTPALAGHHWLRLVDGRDGTPEQLAGARGNAVFIRLTDYEQVPAQLQAAKDAGARVVFFRSDQGGFFETSAYGATEPAYHLEKADAQPLLDRLAAGQTVWLALAGTPESPYSYQLHLPVTQIPANLSYDTRRLGLATVESEFHDTGDGGKAIDTRYAITPTELAAYSSSQLIPKPLRRIDYLSSGDVIWRHEAVANLTAFFERAITTGFSRTYRPGERDREVWFPALMRPGMPPVAWPADAGDLAYGTPANRANDILRVAMPQYASGAFDEYGWLDYSSDRALLSLRRNGELIGTSTLPATQFTLPGAAATYQLALDVARDRDDAPSWWTTSTATSTTWTFRSAHTATPEVLPLIQVGYELDTDLRNVITGNRLVLRPGYQPGATARGPIELRAELSYDDGKTWQRLDGWRDHDGATTVWLRTPPRGATFASLRVSAWDGAGNRLDQTITRAWRAAPPG